MLGARLGIAGGEGPRPIESETFDGSWVGIAPAHDALLIIDVHRSGEAAVTIAEQHTAHVRVRSFDIDKLVVRGGSFEARAASEFIITGTAKRGPTSGMGSCIVTGPVLDELSGVKFSLFMRRGSLWLDDVLAAWDHVRRSERGGGERPE